MISTASNLYIDITYLGTKYKHTI